MTNYLGEIRMFTTDFAPRDWVLCNGQELAIGPNHELFTLIGTTYGGDGKTTFAVPNLQGKVPVHYGNVPDIGDTPFASQGGEEGIRLSLDEMPMHTHGLVATTEIGVNGIAPGSNSMLANATVDLYSTNTTNNLTDMSSYVIGSSCGNNNSVEPHENRQPYLTVNFCICIAGVTPYRK